MNSVKVLSIGSDTKLFEKGSAVRARVAEYGKLFKEYYVVVFAKSGKGYKREQIADNVWIYPTHSFARVGYPVDGFIEANKIVEQKGLKPEDTVVTVQDPFESGIVGYFLKRWLGFPLHVQVHTDFLSPEFVRGSLLNRVRLKIAPRVLRAADAVKVVSERIKKSLIETYGTPAEKIAVLPIFVETSASANGGKAIDLHDRFGKKAVFLMASRLTEEKRVDVAIRVFAEVAKENENVALCIVGSGPKEKELRALAGTLGVSGHVFFEGWQNDLAPYYQGADAFVLTSAFEGYGMTLIEAATAGLPIVSTDVGVAPELFTGDAEELLCPVGDIECLGRAMRDLLSDESRRKFGESMRKNATKFAILKEEYLARMKESIESAARDRLV